MHQDSEPEVRKRWRDDFKAIMKENVDESNTPGRVKGCGEDLCPAVGKCRLIKKCVLPYVSDADVATKAAEHDVFHVVHVLFDLLDLQVARVYRALDVLHLRLQETSLI